MASAMERQVQRGDHCSSTDNDNDNDSPRCKRLVTLSTVKVPIKCWYDYEHDDSDSDHHHHDHDGHEQECHYSSGDVISTAFPRSINSTTERRAHEEEEPFVISFVEQGWKGTMVVMTGSCCTVTTNTTTTLSDREEGDDDNDDDNGNDKESDNNSTISSMGSIAINNTKTAAFVYHDHNSVASLSSITTDSLLRNGEKKNVCTIDAADNIINDELFDYQNFLNDNDDDDDDDDNDDDDNDDAFLSFLEQRRDSRPLPIPSIITIVKEVNASSLSPSLLL